MTLFLFLFSILLVLDVLSTAVISQCWTDNSNYRERERERERENVCVCVFEKVCV